MQALSRAELLALLGAANAHSKRDWLMILVAFNHGLRASEVIALTPDNVQDGFLTVQRLKGSNRTTQPLIESEEPLLNERLELLAHMRGMASNQRLFKISRVQFWRVVQRHAEQAGLPAHQRHPHMLKHSIAMQTIKSAGIENVRVWLGHKNMGSTGEYLKPSEEMATGEIRRALGSSVA